MLGESYSVRTLVEKMLPDSRTVSKIFFTGPPEFLPVLPVACNKKLSKVEKWHRTAGPVEVKVVLVQQKSYWKLSTGPAFILDAGAIPR